MNAMPEAPTKKNPKLKDCRACDKEIGKSVKVCPHCGTKQRRVSKLGILLLVVGLIWAFADGEKGARAARSAPSEAKRVAVGESERAGDYEIAIVAAEVRSRVGNAMFETSAPEGARYMVVHTRVKNITKEPLSAFSRPSIRFVDGEGTEYSPDVGASGAYGAERNVDTKILSNLNPGVSMDLVAVFEVGDDALRKQGSRVVINADEELNVFPTGGRWKESGGSLASIVERGL
jgi:hypothetical protein